MKSNIQHISMLITGYLLYFVIFLISAFGQDISTILNAEKTIRDVNIPPYTFKFHEYYVDDSRSVWDGLRFFWIKIPKNL